MSGAISKGESNNRFHQCEVGTAEGRVAVYKQLDEDGQVDFKGKSKVFARTYDFSHRFWPYTNADWGEAFDISGFPCAETSRANRRRFVSRNFLEAIDMDSYLTEKAGGGQNSVTKSGC
jgi:hypothetical protein